MTKQYDIYDSYGNISIAERTVKDGRIKVDGLVYYHPELIHFNGNRVTVKFKGSSPFSVGPISVFATGEWAFEICEIQKPT